MSNIPEELLYTEDHEWLLVEGDTITVGITDHAQDQLGDIVYLGEFPDIGTKVERGDVIGIIESVKATSDLFAPVSGKILEVNMEIIEAPETVNADPYKEGWMLRMKLGDKGDLGELVDSGRYAELAD